MSISYKTINCIQKGCEKQKIIMCVGLFLCCDSILLYKIENTFRNIFRRGEGIMAAELKPIDVICQPSRDGKITPMKIRVIDEDGEYQEYKIKGYNIIMRNIYSLPCDSDTFGAIAGGVAEEFYHGFGDIDAEGILKKHLTDDLYEILMR